MAEVYVDGAFDRKTGQAAAGIYIRDEQLGVRTFTVPLNANDNHEAEFKALAEALKIGRSLKLDTLLVKTDSQLLEQSVDSRYIKNSQYAPLLEQVLELADQFGLFFIKWIPDTQNKADRLARAGLV